MPVPPGRIRTCDTGFRRNLLADESAASKGL
jgi:hypothetical protein